MTKVLLMNAAQAPKCALDRKSVLLQECWQIPDDTLTDYGESYDEADDECETLNVKGTINLVRGHMLRISKYYKQNNDQILGISAMNDLRHVLPIFFVPR